jgi:hypothetical protein
MESLSGWALLTDSFSIFVICVLNAGRWPAEISRQSPGEGRSQRPYPRRVWAIVQLVSQVFSSSMEKACSHIAEVGVISDHT